MKHWEIMGASVCRCIEIRVPFLRVFKKSWLLDCPVVIVTKHLSLVPLAPLITSFFILSCIHYAYMFLGANSGTRGIYALQQGCKSYIKGTRMEGNISIL